LIQSFRSSDQFDDADNCYYEYRLLQRDQNSGLPKVLDYVAWMSCGFGVKPFNTIIFTMFIFFLFSSIYYILISEMSFSNASWFSVLALLSLPKELAVFGDDKYKNFIERKTFRLNLVRYLYIFERLIG
jgi:hypothetical protein